MKILLIRLSSLGDIVLATSLLKPLRERYPESEISFVTFSPYLPLLQGNPFISRIIPFEKEAAHGGFLGLIRFLRSLQKERFDILIDLHRNLRSQILSLFSGAKKRRSYSKEIWKRRAIVLFKKRWTGTHTVQKYLKVLESLEISTDHATPGLYLSEEEKKWADQILGNSKITNHHSPFSILVGMAPGARRATKRWTPSGFAAVGDRVTRELNGRVILLGNDEDKETAREVEERMEERVINLAGKTTLRELASLMERCDLVVTNDSGPLHMAGALGKPVVALFGPTVEEFGFTPLNNQSLVLSKDLPCRPCSLHGSNRCPLGHHHCMNTIQPDEVFEAVKEIVER